jgi:hypothetical protein
VRAGRRLRGSGLVVGVGLGQLLVLNGRLVVVVDRFPRRVVVLLAAGERVSRLGREKDSGESKCSKNFLASFSSLALSYLDSAAGSY